MTPFWVKTSAFSSQVEPRMSSLGVLLRLPRTRDAVHPPTPPRESRVANARSSLGARVLTLARTWSRTSHVQVCPPLHPGAVSPSQAPVHTAPACTARGRPTPSLPRSSPSPGPPSGSPSPSSASLASARPALAPTQGALEAGPGGRFKRPRDADGVSAVESPAGRAAAATEEENAEPAGRTEGRAHCPARAAS